MFFARQGGAPAHISSAPSTPLLRLDYNTHTAPRTLSTLSLSAAPVRLTDSQNQLVWPSSFFPSCLLGCAPLPPPPPPPPPPPLPPPLLLLLLLPGVNLRRREKKTYPSLSSVGGPLPICLHFPPRRHHWLPRRASQLASFSQPRVEQQQLGNIWPPQSARLPVPLRLLASAACYGN